MQTIYLSDSFVVVRLLAGPYPDAQPQPAPAETTDAMPAVSNSAAINPAAATPGTMPETSHPVLVRQGFEIVDKRANRQIYLDGPWAELFARQIEAWKLKTPSEDEVESTLEGYAELAQTPLRLH